MSQTTIRAWGKRAGVAGFLFFFVKGMLWLALLVWPFFLEGCSPES